MRAARVLALACLSLLCAAARAQAPAAPPRPTPQEDFRRLCATVSMNPIDGREMARRSECVLAGVLPSPNRLAEARGLARAALQAGEPSGGLMLYLVFQADPANQFLKDGKVDPAAYQRLAARPIAERKDQVEAIEALGFAAGRSQLPAAVLLAGYFHDTVAPGNFHRVGALAALVIRNGEHGPVVERLAREADAVAQAAPQTKASIRGFFETYGQALAIVKATYQQRSGGNSCQQPQLKSVTSGDIRGAEYLPLTGNMVKDSYLVHGQWTEVWTFDACGQDVPLKVGFAADGWGGAVSTVSYDKGD
ncbi:MAG: hypothetical protein KGL68_17695 [Burkholderiales bacterium]|nr:hypothetical protein [Burkholderiales bacterium]